MSDRTSGKVVEPVATEMVRRVAAAIALAEKTNPAWRANPDSWIEWVDTARAAIEAMREPTPEMLAETLPAPGIHCDPKTTRLAEMALNLLEPNGIPDKAHLSGLDAARALIGDWYSMIDASLHEGEAER